MIRHYSPSLALAILLAAGNAGAVDDQCTADPTFTVNDNAGPVTMFQTNQNPAGIDFYTLTSVGPTCVPGSYQDVRCCPFFQFVDPNSYYACKTQQAQMADAYLQDLRARMPLLPPVRDANVDVWEGYYYDYQNAHFALDYGKTSINPNEPYTFGLYAPAEGEVIYAQWDSPQRGNIVAIRHQAPDGTEYVTSYWHVRGGDAHDKQSSCPCISSGSTSSERLANCSATEKATPICKYAANPAYDTYWGTWLHTMPAVGTWLERGDRFGWAGNTGTVIAVLDANGNLTQSNGNIHLHFSLGVERPIDNDGNDFVAIDPLSVYSVADNQCYEPDAGSTYARMLAPFLPEFVNVSYSVINGNDHMLYYPDAGWGPQTLDYYLNAAGQVMATGAFDASVASTDWKFWPYVSKAILQDKIAGYTTRKVRQISALFDGANPRYTAIWEGKLPGEQAEAYPDLSDTQYAQLWNDKVVNGSFGILDHFIYYIGSTRHHAVSYATSVTEFNHQYDRTATQILQDIPGWDAVGWKPYAISATAGPTGSNVRFSVIWRPLPGTWKVELDVSATAFATKNDQMKADGYRLHRSQGYDQGTKFLAIWTK